MKFLIDVCAGTRLAKWLREKGHDVLEVREVDCRMTDEDVIRLAEKEQRIIITLDKDFGQLAISTGNLRAAIVRLPDVSLIERKKILENLISRHKSDLESLCIITISKGRMRIRKLVNQES